MGGYVQAHQALSATVGAAIPNPPPLVLWGLGALGAAAFGLEVWSENQANKRYKSENLEQKKAELYYQKAAEMQGKPVVNVHVHGVTDPAVQTSRYLMEEGNTDTATDCFACASSHLGAAQKGTEKMLEHYQKEGQCGDKCQQWGNMNAQELASLLAKDWTDERINAQPEPKKRVLEKYRAEVRGVMTDMLGGDEQAQLINEAAGLLDESLRFTNAGDSLDHPEVDGRLKSAESSLAAAERVDIAALPPDVANKLRTIRQTVGSKVNTPDDLKKVRAQARELANTVNSQAFSGLDQGNLFDLNNRASGIYDGFKRDRKHVDRPYETRAEKAEHIREGLIKAAAEKE